MIYYQDNEIKIRDIIKEDVVSLFIWRLDKELNKHDPRPIPGTSDELVNECIDFCKRFNVEVMNENIRDRKYRYFIICTLDGQPIGSVNFFSIDKENKQGEMGVVIGDKRYWKLGIGFRAVNAAVDYIFNNMDINRIYIETGERNIAAQKLFQKLKFIKCDEYVEEEDFKFIVMEKRKMD
jgi:RimJ/RimL family protein N-acetyltransferase